MCAAFASPASPWLGPFFFTYTLRVWLGNGTMIHSNANEGPVEDAGDAKAGLGARMGLGGWLGELRGTEHRARVLRYVE